MKRLRCEIEAATDGLTEQDWLRAPRGAWNSAQILEHLARSYSGTAKMVELHLGSSRPPQLRSARLGERLRRLLVVTLGRFPSGGQAPAFVQPRGIAGAQALEQALSGLQRMSAALDAAEQRWGRRISVGRHFLLGPMTARQWKKFHYLHGHHHMRQLRATLGARPADGESGAGGR